MAELIGTTIEGYLIEAELGRGGQAVVYRATQESLQRTVALKLVSEQLSGDPGFMERFKREGISAASLDHPHVIPVYEAGDGGGHAFLAMKYVEGPSLDGIISSHGALPVQRALALLRQVAEALDEIHGRGLVHRDVKPANILIGPGDHAYLSDFGLSKALADARLTGTGVWMGTFEYVAPEQIRGEQVTSAADRYAFGAVAYESLTGRPLFERDDRSAMLYAHLNDTPDPPSGRRPSLGERVDAVVLRALAKRPEDRYPTASAFVQDLVAAVSATPGAADATQPGSPTVTEPAVKDGGASATITEGEQAPPVPPQSGEDTGPPPTVAPGGPAPAPGPPASRPQATGRPPWVIPAAVGGGLVVIVVIVLLVVLSSRSGGTDLDLADPGPATDQPLGDIVPRQVPRWSLSGVDAQTLNINFPAGLVEGAESAQAISGDDVALLMGIEPANASVVGAIEDGIRDEEPRFVDSEAGRVRIYDGQGGVVAVNSDDQAQFVVFARSQADAVDLLEAVAATRAAEG